MIEKFIAKRFMGKGNAYRIAKPIMKIAVAGTAISVAVMLLAVFIVKGFQEQIRDKVIGFGGHIQITALEQQKSNQSSRLYLNRDQINALKDVPSIQHVQPYALQPGILESDEGLQGIVLKGVDSTYQWNFIKSNLIAGTVITKSNSSILISEGIANKLRLQVGDALRVFAVTEKQNLKPRKLTVTGIFATGLEDVDNQIAFVPLTMLQQINKWGLQTTISIDSASNTISAKVYGGFPPYQIFWSERNWQGLGPHQLINKDIQVFAADDANTLTDTAYYFHTSRQTIQGKSTDSCYVGGLEVLIANYADLFTLDELVYNMIPYNTKTTTILETNPEIFSWLNMLDANVAIILIIMAIVAIINLSSTLLILILEKTQAIGLFKAIGASQWSIRRIFLFQANYILIRGLIIGNCIAFLLAFIQYHFKILSLDSKSYFISEVPITFPWKYILAINCGTYVLCLFMMIIPAQLIARISPIKAIKFN